MASGLPRWARRSAIACVALLSGIGPAQAEKLGDLCGERINQQILSSFPEIKPGSSTGGKFTMGRDGFGIQRGIEGLSIQVRWTTDNDWTTCDVSHSGTNCGNLFDIADIDQEALDGGGPNPEYPEYSALHVISRINGQGARARLINSQLTDCSLHADRPFIRANIPDNSSIIGRKYPISFGWIARYAIADTDREFLIRYVYNGYTTWYHEKAAF